MYDVKRFLGRGCYSLVYEVERGDAGVNCQRFAFKRTFFYRSGAIQCAIREWNAFKRLQEADITSPFLPTLYHSFMIGQNSSVLVMDLSSGKDLSDILNTFGRINEYSVLFYVAEIMCALEKLHQLRIVHMDLKPENVILLPSGHLMLSDFDRSNDLLSENLMTPEWISFGGTEGFIAPEVVSNRIVSTVADIWGLGMITAILACGALSPSKRSASEKFVYRSFYLKNLSEPLQRFIESCLSLDYNLRPEIAQLKLHKFFENLDWNDVHSCKLIPPYDPSVIRHASKATFNATDAKILLLALDENPPFLFDLPRRETLDESIDIFPRERLDRDSLLASGFTTKRIEELFANFEFVHQSFRTSFPRKLAQDGEG
nr:ribosomal protein s kinase alpha [Hymenolepis microstoma]